MKLLSLILFGLIRIGSTIFVARGRLKVSDDQSDLVHPDGKSFLWLQIPVISNLYRQLLATILALDGIE